MRGKNWFHECSTCVFSERADDVVEDHGAVASDFEEHDDVEKTVLGSGCPLFQDKQLMSMPYILRGDIIEDRRSAYTVLNYAATPDG